jgi:hypothetical protein
MRIKLEVIVNVPNIKTRDDAQRFYMDCEVEVKDGNEIISVENVDDYTLLDDPEKTEEV